MALDSCHIAIALSPLAIVPFHREIAANQIVQAALPNAIELCPVAIDAWPPAKEKSHFAIVSPPKATESKPSDFAIEPKANEPI